MSLPPAPLDGSFGRGGKALLDASGADDARDVVVQADGKVVVAGGSYEAPPNFPVVGPETPVLVRFSRDGRPDPGFGTGGVVKVAGRGGFEAVAVVADGRIVAVGSWAPNSPRLAGETDLLVARFLPDGSPDPSFGTNGVAVLDLGAAGGNEAVEAVAVDAEGRVVLVGILDFTPPATPTGFSMSLASVARLTAAGAPDPTFGGGDGVSTVVFGETDASPSGVVIQGDGKILVGGTHANRYVTDSYNAEFGVARFNPDGTPDTSFGGGDGFFATLVDGRQAQLNALLLRPDGRILAVGTTSTGTYDAEAAFAEFNPDGSMGPGGMSVFDPPGVRVSAFDAALGEDGSVYAAGIVRELVGSPPAADNNFGLIRLAPGGGFSFGAVDVTRGAGQHDYAWAVALRPNGRAVIAGTADSPGDPPSRDVAVVQVRASALRRVRGAAPAVERSGAPIRFANGAVMRLSRRGVLTLRGTSAADTIGLKFRKGTPAEGPPLDVTVNAETKSLDVSSLAPGGLTWINVSAQAGNDSVAVHANVSVPTRLDGGAGDDTLVGGSGPDALSGGAGMDKLSGMVGGDYLRGGTGIDSALEVEDVTDLLVRGIEMREPPHG